MAEVISVDSGNVSEECKQKLDAIERWLAKNEKQRIPMDFPKQVQDYVIVHLNLKGMSDEEYQKIEDHIIRRYTLTGGDEGELVRKMRAHRERCNLSSTAF